MTKKSTSGGFDEAKLWSKVKRFGRRMGRAVLKPAFVLYYLWMKPETPPWAKAIIASALIYPVCPVDAIPDMLPGGYVDDAGSWPARSPPWPRTSTRPWSPGPSGCYGRS
ncbi:MAG: DUF1232 domain-containing protein [Pseudomonadota bacterium]